MAKRAHMARLAVLVLLALPAALALGALVAWAWPAVPTASPTSVETAKPSAPNASTRAAPQRVVRTTRVTAAPAQARRASTKALAPAAKSAAAATTALAATVPITLCAKSGTTTLPDSAVVTFWGFALGACSTAGPAQLPGPLLDVGLGDVLDITLDNSLAQNVALAFPGQAPLVPDNVGATSGGTRTYSVTVSRPGTFLYEAGGPNAPRQVAMGLYGALIVRSGTAGQAYGTAESAYDAESVLVLGEIDPALNANPTGFDLNNYAPKYFLINGQAYDDTTEIEAAAGARVLLRYVNGTLSHHTMELLGLRQLEIAEDAYPLDDPLDVIAETFPSGTTGDMIVTISGGATAGTQFPLFSRNLNVTNDGSFPGGMLTFVTVTP
jgi:FtsP/CotA-like multicopper oxidase with cupredoxin domain